MQVNVQVQMQGGVGDSCIFRRIGIRNGLFFVLLLVWRMKFFFFSVGIRCFSDIYKDTYHQSYICGIHVSRGILRGLLRISLFLVINMKWNEMSGR